MESLKDQRQLLRGDLFTAVGNGKINLVTALPDGNAQLPILGTEFYRIVHQIVDHLIDGILICPGEYGMFRHFHLNIDIFAKDLLLKGDEHLSGHFRKVKSALLLLGYAPLLLQTGDVQHIAHQAAEPLGLLGDQIQVFPALFRGDGAVENAVHIAGDGGHGGFQLMGHIGHKLLTLILALFQRSGHVVKGQSQLLHFLRVVAGGFDPGAEIAVAEGLCRPGHIPQGIGLPADEKSHNGNGYNNHQNGHHKKGVGNAADIGEGIVHRGRDHNDGLGRAGSSVGYRHGCHVAVFFIQSADDTFVRTGTLGKDPVPVAFIQLQPCMLTAHGRIGTHEQISLGVADDGIRAGYGDGNRQRHVKILIGDAFVPIAGLIQRCDHLGIVFQRCDGLLRQMAAGKPLKRTADQYHCRQQNHRYGNKQPAECAFHGSSASCNRYETALVYNHYNQMWGIIQHMGKKFTVW